MSYSLPLIPSSTPSRRTRWPGTSMIRSLILMTSPSPASAQHRTHPREKLGEAEGLGDVIVGSGVEADDHVDLLGSGGEYEYRKVPPVGARLAGHVEAVYVGKAEVEYDDVDPALHGLQGVTACFGELDIVALASQSAKERT